MPLTFAQGFVDRIQGIGRKKLAELLNITNYP
jgi:hypothetical protein